MNHATKTIKISAIAKNADFLCLID